MLLRAIRLCLKENMTRMFTMRFPPYKGWIVYVKVFKYIY